MTIIEEAHIDIIGRLDPGISEGISEVILRWLRRTYTLGALDERSKHEHILDVLQRLQEVNADQLRELNTYRRLLINHGLL